jgi:hypothetical protein
MSNRSLLCILGVALVGFGFINNLYLGNNDGKVLAEQRTQIVALKSALKLAHSKAHHFQSSARTSDSTLANQRKETARERKLSGESTKLNKEHLQHIQELKETNRQLKQAKDKLDAQVEELGGCTAQAKAAESLTEQMKDLKEQKQAALRTHQAETETLQAKVKDLQAEVDDFSAIGVKEPEDCSSQETAVQALQSKVTTQEADSKGLREDAAVCESTLAKAKEDAGRRLAQEKRKCAELKDELDQAKHETAAEDATGAKPPSGGLQKMTTPYFCPDEISDNNKYRAFQRTLTPRTKMGGDERGEWLNISITPTYFCDKLKVNLRPYVKPKLKHEDLVVGLFTGDSLFYGRASANRDTWLNRLPHRYMFAATSEPRIPVHGLESYGIKPDYESNYNAQFVQLFAVKEMYERSPDRKWYFILGDDNYVHIDQTLIMLQDHDDSKDIWLTNQRMLDTIPADIDLSKWPNYAKNWAGKGAEKRKYAWASGASSWFTSTSVTKAFAAEIDRFVNETNLWEQTITNKICYCPDKISGLVLSLLGYDITMVGSKYSLAMIPHATDSMVSGKFAYMQDTLLVYHYVSPREMLSADQRVIHEKLDRMINADMVDEIIVFFRQFIDEHFDVIRRRQVEVKYLANKALCKEGDPRIHARFGDSLYNVYNDIPDIGPISDPGSPPRDPREV